MAKEGGSVLHFLAWITGVIVSLVIGNGMIDKVLTIPGWLAGNAGNGIIAVVIGWIIVVTTLISAVMAIVKR